MQKPVTSSSSVRYITVSADQAGQRLDNFLMAEARSVPKSHIYRIIRTGQVRANGGRVKPTYRLQEDDSIRIPPLAQAGKVQVRVPDTLVAALEDAVIFEDDELIVINKPAGLAVHAGSGLHFGVIDAFRQSRVALATRLELIHRLDRGTSGCLMMGKSRKSTQVFQQVFRERQIGKHYSALVCGHWPTGKSRVALALSKNVEQGGERMVKVDPAGKEAVSHFTLDQKLGSESAVQVRIETGRTHQIRVHAAETGHAVIGDERYGDAADLQRHRKLGLKRLFLHCSSLELQGAHKHLFTAPTDKAWQACQETLRCH